MAFQTPDYDSVESSASEFELPDEGWHDVTITHVEAARTNRGSHPMLVLTFTIDSGQDAGYSWKEYCAFIPGKKYGWARLKAICEAASYSWKKANTIEKFAAQFPEGELRLSVDVEYRYSVKGFTDEANRYRWTKVEPERTADCIYEQWVDVQPSTWEEWEGEEKSRMAQTRDTRDYSQVYAPPENDEPTMPMGSEPTESEEPSEKVGHDDLGI